MVKMTLAELEIEIVVLHGSFSLRQTLEMAMKLGELLQQAKMLLRQGEWLPWLQKNGIGQRSARIYLQVFRHKRQLPAENKEITIDAFLGTIRQARKTAKQAEIEEERQ